MLSQGVCNNSRRKVLLLILILQVKKSWWWERKDSIARDIGLQNNTGVGSTTLWAAVYLVSITPRVAGVPER